MSNGLHNHHFALESHRSQREHSLFCYVSDPKPLLTLRNLRYRPL